MSNNSKKKATKIIVYVVAISMLVGTFATVFTMGRKNDTTKKVVAENSASNVSKDNSDSQEVEKEITEEMKKAIENAKVKVEDKKVTANINIGKEVNKIQIDKLLNDYSKKLQEEYAGKDITINITDKNRNTTTSNTYANVSDGKKVDGSLPKMSVRIEPAITEMDRHVIVTLDTDTPEKYTVKVLGEECRYAENKDFYHTVVFTTDENEIKKGIEITLKK